MSEDKTINIELTKQELEVLVKATGSAAPTINDEVIQFKLYHKLLFKLNELR